MLSSAATAALRDIAHHIELAGQFTAGFDYDTFRHDPRTVYAVTRCLEIISEASRGLPDELKARHPAADLPNPFACCPSPPDRVRGRLSRCAGPSLSLLAGRGLG